MWMEFYWTNGFISTLHLKSLQGLQDFWDITFRLAYAFADENFQPVLSFVTDFYSAELYYAT
jgi:hypothetical protein